MRRRPFCGGYNQRPLGLPMTARCLGLPFAGFALTGLTGVSPPPNCIHEITGRCAFFGFTGAPALLSPDKAAAV